MKKIFLVCLLFLSSCSGSKNKEKEESTVLVDLVESTHIMGVLISQNKLSDLLQEHDEDQLSLLLDNYSPAQLAFESEVRSSTIPLILMYYFKDSPEEQIFIERLKKLAQEYDDRVKFVIIDVEKLFVLAEYAQIEKCPTAILIKNDDVIFNITDNITIDSLERNIKDELTEK